MSRSRDGLQTPPSTHPPHQQREGCSGRAPQDSALATPCRGLILNQNSAHRGLGSPTGKRSLRLQMSPCSSRIERFKNGRTTHPGDKDAESIRDHHKTRRRPGTRKAGGHVFSRDQTKPGGGGGWVGRTGANAGGNPSVLESYIRKHLKLLRWALTLTANF